MKKVILSFCLGLFVIGLAGLALAQGNYQFGTTYDLVTLRQHAHNDSIRVRVFYTTSGSGRLYCEVSQNVHGRWVTQYQPLGAIRPNPPARHNQSDLVVDLPVSWASDVRGDVLTFRLRAGTNQRIVIHGYANVPQ